MNHQNMVQVSWQDNDAFEDTNQIKQIFEQYGQIQSVYMNGNCAFINYTTQEAAQEAIESLNNFELNDQTLKVFIAKHPLAFQCFNCGKLGHIARDCPQI